MIACTPEHLFFMKRVIPQYVPLIKTPQIKKGYIPNGRGRKYAVTECLDGWKDAFAAFNLTPVTLEPKFKNFIGQHYMDGAHTGIHKDETTENMVHVRCNILLKAPSSGGFPIITNRVLKVQEGDMWLCFASEEMHGSTPIYGGERVIFSYGALIPVQTIKSELYE